MFKDYPFSKTTYYRRKMKALELGCDIMDVPDSRGSHSGHTKVENHYRWQKGKQVHSGGYTLIRVGHGHPLADSNGYALEHRIVWASAGRDMKDDDVLHHINGNKKDNRIDNLQAMSNSEHIKLHIKTQPNPFRRIL